MTEEIKKTEELAAVEVVSSRGDRGKVGSATPAVAIRQLWHETHFLLQNVGDKHNPRKSAWVRKAGAPSLKQFARQLLSEDNQIVKAWLSNKRGIQNTHRSDANQKRIALEKQASKAARRGKPQGKQNKTAKAATLK